LSRAVLHRDRDQGIDLQTIVLTCSDPAAPTSSSK